jgi:hypothetical protein
MITTMLYPWLHHDNHELILLVIPWLHHDNHELIAWTPLTNHIGMHHCSYSRALAIHNTIAYMVTLNHDWSSTTQKWKPHLVSWLWAITRNSVNKSIKCIFKTAAEWVPKHWVLVDPFCVLSIFFTWHHQWPQWHSRNSMFSSRLTFVFSFTNTMTHVHNGHNKLVYWRVGSWQ